MHTVYCKLLLLQKCRCCWNFGSLPYKSSISSIPLNHNKNSTFNSPQHQINIQLTTVDGAAFFSSIEVLFSLLGTTVSLLGAAVSLLGAAVFLLGAAVSLLGTAVSLLGADAKLELLDDFNSTASLIGLASLLVDGLLNFDLLSEAGSTIKFNFKLMSVQEI